MASILKVDTIQDQDGNNIINESAGTITIGKSGDTVQVASGAEFVGGGTQWQSAIKTASFTAVAGEGYFIDTSSNVITMTLPAGNVGDSIEFVDATGAFGTNTFTIAADGSEKIQGSTDNLIFVKNNEGGRLVYSGATDGWTIPSSNTIPQPPTLASVTGNLYAGMASTLSLNGTNFLTSDLVVNFVQALDGVNVDVTVTPSSGTTATVTVPSSVFDNVTLGNAVTIKVTNSDGFSSNTVDKTSIAAPSGGTITTSGDFRIHTFTSSSNFVNTISSLTTEYLVIAGGGGGGSVSGGGGGAGGYRASANESNLTLATGTFTVTVGSGGAGSPDRNSGTGTSGNNSVFSTITSTGGGGGGTIGNGNGYQDGLSGGSGGGGSYSPNGSGGSGTSGQGNDGGYGRTRSGGGGGGAGAAGGNSAGDDSLAGAGGNGSASSITGSSVTRAGGGGGGGESGAGGTGNVGGSGGGGDGVTSGDAFDGTVNTGSGGGGGGYPPDGDGGNGGTGIVIVRYDTSNL